MQLKSATILEPLHKAGSKDELSMKKITEDPIKRLPSWCKAGIGAKASTIAMHCFLLSTPEMISSGHPSTSDATGRIQNCIAQANKWERTRTRLTTSTRVDGVSFPLCQSEIDLPVRLQCKQHQMK